MVPYVTGRLYPLDIEPILAELKGAKGPFVFLETARATGEETTSCLFQDPMGEIVARGPEDVSRVHREIEDALAAGHHLAGWWAYEWGYALEPKLHGLLARRRPEEPLVWLGVFREPRTWVHDPEGGPAFPGEAVEIQSQLGPLGLSLDFERYAAAIGRLQEHIAAGDTYQVNYTLKGQFRYDGDPLSLYRFLRSKQAVSYGALIRRGDLWILSLSPELFFRREGERIESKPMKGTLGRGRTTGEDAALALRLSRDPKSRAENIMIVDLLRNDIGRLSVHGTVTVPDLLQVERYETLLQMVSRIRGRLAPGTSWEDVFRSLFPCGSVTGAPKIRTMEIIADVEPEPRGVYTGAVGYLAPGGKAVLSVAIRTVTLRGHRAEIGIGGGIVADSDAAAEFAECRLKADFLTQPRPEFCLLETIRWDPGRGYFLLERHMARLADSAHCFGYPSSVALARDSLRKFSASLDPTGPPHRVRLLLERSGMVRVSGAPLAGSPPGETVPVDFSKNRVSSCDPFLYHKTTHRAFYDDELRRAREKGLFEYLFLNERGEVTEGTRTNVFVEAEGGLLETPPASCGLLCGVLRQELIESGRARERMLSAVDVRCARAIYVGNSVRGLLQARLVTGGE